MWNLSCLGPPKKSRLPIYGLADPSVGPGHQRKKSLRHGITSGGPERHRLLVTEPGAVDDVCQEAPPRHRGFQVGGSRASPAQAEALNSRPELPREWVWRSKSVDFEGMYRD